MAGSTGAQRPDTRFGEYRIEQNFSAEYADKGLRFVLTGSARVEHF
jgi:hypothetical protein